MSGSTYLKVPSLFFCVMSALYSSSPEPDVQLSKNFVPERMSVPFWWAASIQQPGAWKSPWFHEPKRWV